MSTQPSPAQSGHPGVRAAFAWLRRLAAVAILVGGVLALNAGHLDTCEQKQSLLGAVSEVCHRPAVDDPVVLGTLLIVLLLLAPDVSEFSVFGLASLKWRVRAQEARSDATDAELRELRASISAISTATSASRATSSVNVILREAGRESARIVEDPAPGDIGGGPGIRPVNAPSPPSRLLAAGKVLAGTGAIRAILDSVTSDVRASTGVTVAAAHLYLPNDRGLLIPVDDPDRPENESGWPAGAGAVGTVWQTGDAEVRRGLETQRGLDQLDPRRREWYKSTQLVLAVPVQNLSGRTIGVLSASSPEPGNANSDKDVVETLEVHAQAAARTVIDLLGWDTDAP